MSPVYGSPDRPVPCWDKECPGQIRPDRDPKRRRCTVCGRRAPDLSVVTRSVVLFIALIVLWVVVGVAMFVYGATGGFQR